MSGQVHQSAAEAAQALTQDLASVLKTQRNIDLNSDPSLRPESLNVPQTLLNLVQTLNTADFVKEAEALETVHYKTTLSPNHNGLGITEGTTPSRAQHDEILFLAKAWLQSIKSSHAAPNFLEVSPNSVEGREPMTLTQKILLQHYLPSPAADTSSIQTLPTGSVISIGIDWILASELSWDAMVATYKAINSPGIFRNDRLWIAGDHVVHPTIRNEPKVKRFVDKAEAAKYEFLLTEYQGMNYSIMHTEFARERAEPGMIAIGSNSHTCSAGAVSALSFGLGTADVNDDLVVEFDGEGKKYLSVDARFAICNMCTEWGAITGIFVPDSITRDYVARRRRKANKSSSLYFKPDPNAQYAETFKIDLSRIEAGVAIYPNPDDVVPVSEKAGFPLDGVFIGACTTTEEELVLGALVLQAGLKKELPLAKGKRHYVPGSLPIVETLRGLHLLDVYEKAGFTRGPPGCSLCLGLSAEKAKSGETWLSSQNRNFKNRMGAGSFGHLSSAAVCAASAFSMTVTSPAELLKQIDVGFWNSYKAKSIPERVPDIPYVEPLPQPHPQEDDSLPTRPSHVTQDEPIHIESKIIVLEDFVDTDALAPGEALTACETEEEFAKYCLVHTHPDFRAKVAAGSTVVVAGEAFGIGSSREQAVSALKGAGVKAVVAKSFAFIYSRNQPSLGLLGIVMPESSGFYQKATEGKSIDIDVEERLIKIDGEGEWSFQLSAIEEGLLKNKGIAQAYSLFGRGMWDKFLGEETKQEKSKVTSKGDERLQW
ncbi:hypothetical protein PRZ48_000104 [Zasmidium cellare]|uniref:Uncharacterized protein n=1 Tax=Zasmidium cellare TaxID=395010 RepID=A0ABR0EXJ8_ZASCE|nr:hypothetical protein PRZ48_000104 [Zasmidium cellare]